MSEIRRRMVNANFSEASVLFSLLLTVAPELAAAEQILPTAIPEVLRLPMERALLFPAALALTTLWNLAALIFRRKFRIHGHNYEISVEYGDLLEKSDCQKVINFDECFTAEIGKEPWQIKEDSICGQYLKQYPIENMQELIALTDLKPAAGVPPFRGAVRYEPGRLVRRGNDLLMAFARLDDNGHATFSREEYLQCLDVLWKEIEKYSLEKDVCIPVLGAGRTGTGDFRPGQQEALDLILASYRLSPHKLKAPHKLRIICRKQDGFSLNRIGETL